MGRNTQEKVIFLYPWRFSLLPVICWSFCVFPFRYKAWEQALFSKSQHFHIHLWYVSVLALISCLPRWVSKLISSSSELLPWVRLLTFHSCPTCQWNSYGVVKYVMLGLMRALPDLKGLLHHRISTQIHHICDKFTALIYHKFELIY